MVKFRMRKTEIRGDGGNHYTKLRLKRIAHASQFTIADKAGATTDPEGKNTDTWHSKLNLASHTPDYSYLLISFTSCPSSSHMSLSCPQLYKHCVTQS